jgi:hypothetical protein
VGSIGGGCGLCGLLYQQHIFFMQPSLNELPVNSQQNSRKRPAPGTENSDPSVKPPEQKQPRMTVEINLPDDSNSEMGR